MSTTTNPVSLRGLRSVVQRPFLARLASTAHIQTGARCQHGPGALLLNCAGAIEIGDRPPVNFLCPPHGHVGLNIVASDHITSGTVICAANHNVDDVDRLIHEQGLSAHDFAIGGDVWNRAKAIVPDGVSAKSFQRRQ